MTIPPIDGGNAEGQRKLNTLRETANRVAMIRSDEFIRIDRGPGGMAISLNIEAVVARMPKMASGGNSPGEYKGQVHSMVTDVQDGWEFVQFIPYVPE